MGEADFWSDQDKANANVAAQKQLKSLLIPWQECSDLVNDTREMADLAEAENDRELMEEVIQTAETLQVDLEDLDTKSLLRGAYDGHPVFFSIHAGAGGTESCDWAGMLWRMYERFFEQNGYNVKVMDTLPGEEAGYKSVELEVTGPFAYGYLRSEIGVHRLVRISPFDSNKRRHTSFCSVDVIPVIDDTPEVEINPKDLRIDTYRASGAGGQHVNKTDSAVRITHIPTNIVVQCQNDRSQHKNKATAMKMLKSRLYELELEKQKAEEDGIEKSEIGWGHQIRSYVLAPYQQVKDTRSGEAFSNVSGILDGDIDKMIEGVLISQHKGK